MKFQNIVLALVFIAILIGCSDSNVKPRIVNIDNLKVNLNDTIEVYNFKELEHRLYTDKENVHIVNFWAMWCAPCVKEMPILLEYQKNHPEVKLTLVSFDFPNEIETKLKPFLETKGINSEVVILDDPDANSWIDEIDPNWSGAIPFTIIFNNRNRSYHERSFDHLADLETAVNKTFKQ